MMKLYITPDDPDVNDAVDDILNSDWRWAYSDFEALRQWVATNINYVHDDASHGENEYWQLPAETLSLGTGDCEDYAILLCTLLRAYGVPADEVYVGCGAFPEYSTPNHGFLFEHCSEGKWNALEPQQGVWTTFWWGDIDTSVYDKFWSFNDQEYFSGKPALLSGEYEFEVGYSFWPVTRGATVEFERYLNAGQGVTGLVEWWGSSGTTYDWSVTAYKPDGDVLLTWSGTDQSHEFNFYAAQAGTYKIEILKRDYLARSARMEILPPDWTQR
ncbi:hypothetical protein ES703_23542 [subsurface metagenome]